ncbi:FkbM family methyltransferase [Natronospira bacteriovora]|uniref:FkbM family methyltransferase n=1 Tax=Natronospira bacteriovora TaxID=3069753 RepID=A0ABU0W830_9GAMM|nr:FkbM family methyltransferase [Natronospira sp. AB-CW4]MDQ2069165.1 FkbM family methyltransferase [Natronospira sp. AB-CW4]
MNNPIRKFLKRRRQKSAVRAFHQFPIESGDVVIDGGANYGRITLRLIGCGAQIKAFEPNPVAFKHLNRAFGEHPQVECIPKGLSDQNGQATLYLHRRHQEHGLHYSEASSLIADKKNVDKDQGVEIELVDIADVVESAGERIRLLKLDIEGGEYAVLERLLDTGLIHRIDQVFCETHESKIPSMRQATRKLRRRLADEEIHHVNLDWV